MLLRRPAITLLLVATLAACATEDAGRPAGATCSVDQDCETGLCFIGRCMDPDGDDDGDGLSNGDEATAGTNPTQADSDQDGRSDLEEVGDDPAHPPDTDGDGRIDAMESSTHDADHDCVVDERDADDATPLQDPRALVTLACRTEGVCAAWVKSIGARCDAGTLHCDYGQVPPYEGSVETRCDGLDGDCDGSADEDFLVDGKGVGQTCRGGSGCISGVIVCAADGHGAVCAAEGAGEVGVETCNGLDDDCDGEIDEGVPYQGTPVGGPCVGQGACAGAPGVVQCNLDLGEAVCSVGPGGTQSLVATEVCNGLDDDCDGTTDEGLLWTAPDGTTHERGAPCAVGACAGGVVVCDPVDATPTCSALLVAKPELCNGVDDDCDGQTDEGIGWLGIPVGAPCEGLGLCGPGVVECVASTGQATCSTHAGASADEAQPEICDGLDNDCDGIADDGLLWQGIPLGAACAGAGACGPGVVECVEGGQPRCSSDPGGTQAGDEPESCDALDNDCDGATDEELVGTATDCGATGVCAEVASAVCEGGAWQCVPPVDVPTYEADEASCDALDNDCDGATDEGLPMVWGTEWLPVDAGASPPPRRAAAVAFAPESGILWLHGGATGAAEAPEPLADTWSFDPTTNTWAEVGGSGPPATGGAALAWHTATGRLLRTGGEATPTLWSLSPGQGWKSLGVLPGVAPPAVSGATLTPLPDGALVRLGGRTADGAPGGVWRLDPSALTWEELPGGDSTDAARADHAAALDLATGRVLVAGGTTASGDPATTVAAYAVEAGTWSPVATLPLPPGDRPPFALDPYSGLALLPSGDGALQSVSLSDGATSAAPNTDPDGATAVYDATARRALLVRPSEDGTALEELPSICP